ncbi:Flp family type IVb pilin [Tropicimonas sediminicola]|uniref:Pilus assembly protein Flp/PilA n=1 Tax=Tropicimonas sediminicola TaxID=1031541 RepID=A0A239EJW3_9RHOB|nr:hypothetical protein [Tropicimonas sediminicola]SNS44859.1 hypothetical protein SAMN05421757_102190 [Tropicimonas sediminicola]
MKFFLIRFKYLTRDTRGATLVEYGVALSLAMLVGVTALTALGLEIEDAIVAAQQEMPD